MSREIQKSSDLNVGDEVTVNWAAEKFAPISYHVFDVGPFSCTTKIRDGETGLEAMQRAYKVCLEMARTTFKQKRDEFFENVKDAAQAARESAKR